jgi:hypothetical protein
MASSVGIGAPEAFARELRPTLRRLHLQAASSHCHRVNEQEIAPCSFNRQRIDAEHFENA